MTSTIERSTSAYNLPRVQGRSIDQKPQKNNSISLPSSRVQSIDIERIVINAFADEPGIDNGAENSVAILLDRFADLYLTEDPDENALVSHGNPNQNSVKFGYEKFSDVVQGSAGIRQLAAKATGIPEAEITTEDVLTLLYKLADSYREGWATPYTLLPTSTDKAARERFRQEETQRIKDWNRANSGKNPFVQPVRNIAFFVRVLDVYNNRKLNASTFQPIPRLSVPPKPPEATLDTLSNNSQGTLNNNGPSNSSTISEMTGADLVRNAFKDDSILLALETSPTSPNGQTVLLNRFAELYSENIQPAAAGQSNANSIDTKIDFSYAAFSAVASHDGPIRALASKATGIPAENLSADDILTLLNKLAIDVKNEWAGSITPPSISDDTQRKQYKTDIFEALQDFETRRPSSEIRGASFIANILDVYHHKFEVVQVPVTPQPASPESSIEGANQVRDSAEQRLANLGAILTKVEEIEGRPDSASEKQRVAIFDVILTKLREIEGRPGSVVAIENDTVRVPGASSDERLDTLLARYNITPANPKTLVELRQVINAVLDVRHAVPGTENRQRQGQLDDFDRLENALSESEAGQNFDDLMIAFSVDSPFGKDYVDFQKKLNGLNQKQAGKLAVFVGDDGLDTVVAVASDLNSLTIINRENKTGGAMDEETVRFGGDVSVCQMLKYYGIDSSDKQTAITALRASRTAFGRPLLDQIAGKFEDYNTMLVTLRSLDVLEQTNLDDKVSVDPRSPFGKSLQETPNASESTDSGDIDNAASDPDLQTAKLTASVRDMLRYYGVYIYYQTSSNNTYRRQGIQRGIRELQSTRDAYASALALGNVDEPINDTEDNNDQVSQLLNGKSAATDLVDRMTDDQNTAISAAVRAFLPEGQTSLFKYLLHIPVPVIANESSTPENLLAKLLDSPELQALGKKLLDALGWYGGGDGETTSPELVKKLIRKAVALELNPPSGRKDGQVAGYDFAQKDNWGKSYKQIHLDFQKHLHTSGKVQEEAVSKLAALVLRAELPLDFQIDNIPDDLTYGKSPVWVNFVSGVTLAERFKPGSSKTMTAEELINYPAEQSVDASENKLATIQAARMRPVLQWAIANRALPEKRLTDFTGIDIQVAFLVFEKMIEKVAGAVDDLTTPVPDRIKIARAMLEKSEIDPDRRISVPAGPKIMTQVFRNYTNLEAYLAGYLHPNAILPEDYQFDKNYRSDVVLQDYLKGTSSLVLPNANDLFDDQYRKYIAKRRDAYVTVISSLVAGLPEADRIAIEHGEVKLFSVRKPLGDQYERNRQWGEKNDPKLFLRSNRGFIIQASYQGTTTSYEVFPSQSKIVRNDDLPSHFPSPTINVKYAGNMSAEEEVGHNLSVDWEAYQDNKAPREGVQSDVVVEQMGATFPQGSSSAYGRLKDIAIRVDEELFKRFADEYLSIAKGQTNLEKSEAGKKKAIDFVVGLIPFYSSISDLMSDNRMTRLLGGAGLTIDILSFGTPIGKLLSGSIGLLRAARTAGAAGRAATLVPTLPKFSTLSGKLLRSTLKNLNPLDGVPQLVTGLAKGAFKYTRAGLKKIVTGIAEFTKKGAADSSFVVKNGLPQVDPATWKSSHTADQLRTVGGVENVPVRNVGTAEAPVYAVINPKTGLPEGSRLIDIGNELTPARIFAPSDFRLSSVPPDLEFNAAGIARFNGNAYVKIDGETFRSFSTPDIAVPGGSKYFVMKADGRIGDTGNAFEIKRVNGQWKPQPRTLGRGGAKPKPAKPVTLEPAKGAIANIAPLTQDNVQTMWNDDYWKSTLDATAFRDATKKDFWKKYDDKYDADFAKKPDAKYDKKGNKVEERELKDVVGPGEKLLQSLSDPLKANSLQLKVYRGMKNTEADKIKLWSENQKDGVETFIEENANTQLTGKELATRLKSKDNPGIIPVGDHLGGFDQAKEYGKGADEMVLQFTLKPGAHEFLFDPDYMAIARPKDKTASGKGATAFLAQSQELKDGRFFQTATTAEGNLPGYIGMKPEDKGDFSLSLGKSDPSRLTFQLFIAKVDRVDPQTGAIVDWDTGLPI